MASAIKLEVDQISTNLCHGCLCQDRKLKPLSGEIYKLYYSLLGSGIIYDSEQRLICWECEAILRRVRKFQKQILQAQTALMEWFYNVSPKQQTLSTLSISTKDHYDLYYEYIEQVFLDNELDIKPIEFAEQPLTQNCLVKVEKIQLDLVGSDHSDSENDLHNDSINIGISNESMSTKCEKNEQNKIKDIVDKTKNTEITNEPSNEQNKKTRRRKESKKQKKSKCINDSVKKSNKDYEFSTDQTAKYLKYVTIRDLKVKFKKAKEYFKHEVLDLEQIEAYNAKLGKNPCGDRCRQCRFDYRSDFLLLLRQNWEEIMSDSPKACLLCKKKLPDSDNLLTHLKHKHCAFWRCTLCNFYCRYERRLRHLKDQHTKIYTCNKCQGEFTSKRHFFLHFKQLHDTFVCHHCNILFKGSRSKMIKHQLIHADQHVCTICNKQYKGRRYLKTHIKAYHPESLNKKVNKEAAYCVECDKQFPSEAVFKAHLHSTVIHRLAKNAEQSFPCPECDKTFKIKNSMEKHLHQVHMQDKARFKCTICNKIFFSNNSLRVHTERVHLKVPRKKDIFCDICGRGFHAKETLVNHRRTHTGERPFKCVHCSATFAQKSACIMHMRKQHNDLNKYTVIQLTVNNVT